MFKTLGEENINIKVISTSRIKISVLLERKYLELAIQSLHEAFELTGLDYDTDSNNYNSRVLLRQLKTLSELGEAQARLNEIVKIIAVSMKSKFVQYIY